MPLDKRRKIASGRMMGSTTASRGRQAFAVVNNRQDAVVGGTGDLGGTEGSECGSVEFSKDEVEALLNEKIKEKKFDLKVRFIAFIYFPIGLRSSLGTLNSLSVVFL